jgi:hypothetical protein
LAFDQRARSRLDLAKHLGVSIIDELFRGCARTAQRAAKQLLDFLRNNRDDLIDYQRARMEGRRISTASAESVMNHLVNRRMSKRQQMRWDFASAHRMLMVRVDLLDGCLEAVSVGCRTDVPTVAG